MAILSEEIKYRMYFKGLCSTPYAVGIIDNRNNIICQISWDCNTSKEDRKNYTKYSTILNNKFKHILN